LSWTTRVQIALDTARGLEYIHDHTKDQYVHRDVKTDNILLDGSFRAKVLLLILIPLNFSHSTLTLLDDRMATAADNLLDANAREEI
jgi:serine/threonine protein kinase